MSHGRRRHISFIITILSMLSVALLSFLITSHLIIYAASPLMHAKPTTSSGDWSRYLYSDMHQGNNPNETILNTTNASSLTLKWKFQTAGALIGEPIIVNGINYQGSGDRYLYAIDAAGQQVWKTFLGRHSIASCPVAYGITATAAVENGKVYIGLASDCDKPLIQGILYALDATTGAVFAYVNGVLFIAGAQTTINGTVYAYSIGAFDAITGQQLWRFGLPGHIFSSLITANGLLFDGQGKTLEIRDQSNGSVSFSYTLSSNSIKGPVTVLDGRVFLPAVNEKLYVFGL